MKKFLSIFLILSISFAYAEVAKYPNIEGKIIREIPYNDSTGNNMVVLTENEWTTYNSEANGYERNRKIFVYRFNLDTLDDSGMIKREWRIFDYELDCSVDLTLHFFNKHIQLTDLNHNGIKEVWIPYAKNCAGDISPDERKIIMYEGLQKYALRGVSNQFFEDNGYRMDKALQNVPAFSKFAESLWEKIKKADLIND